jgi:hypothetical protein
VTLHSYQSEGVYVAQTVEACHRSSVNARQESDGRYVVPSDEVYWSLWAEKLGGTRPKAPDVIEHEGKRYVIVDEVAELSHGARFRARARLEVG